MKLLNPLFVVTLLIVLFGFGASVLALQASREPGSAAGLVSYSEAMKDSLGRQSLLDANYDCLLADQMECRVRHVNGLP